MSIIVETPVYEQVSEGICRATLNEIDDLGTKQFGKYPAKHYLRLTFVTEQMHSETGRPLFVSLLCTANFGGKSKLRTIAQALLNTQILPRRIDVEEQLIGKKCRLNIVRKIKEGGDVFANIVAVYPPETSQPSPAVSTPASTSTVVTALQTTESEDAILTSGTIQRMRKKFAKPFETGTAAESEVSAS